MSTAHDKDTTWFVDTFTCYAEKAKERVARQKREAEERKGKDGVARPGWDDGLHYTVRPHDPARDKPKTPQPGINPRRPVRGQRAD